MICKLRVPERSYDMFAIQKRPEEQNPWPIITKRAPFSPHLVKVKIPPNTIDM